MRTAAALLVLLVLLSASMDVVPANASTTQNCTAPVGGSCTVAFNLSSSDQVSGSVSVVGGSNDIQLYVTDPSGAQIYNAGRIVGNSSFSFAADATGAFILHFDNSLTSSASKQVTVSYTVTTGGQVLEFPPQTVLIIFLTLLVLTSYLLIRRHIEH